MDIPYKPVMPETNIPIVSVGAGGIVKDAHLPAYKKAGFETLGLYDVNTEKAHQLGAQFGIGNVCESLEQLIALGLKNQAIFDLAVPASEIAGILEKLPIQSTVLIQKPMGEDLNDARKILSLCQNKGLTAAVNFQLRFAPFVKAARYLINSGVIGDLYDLEVKLCTYTPWNLWSFLASLPRVEILYHSIHYLDMVRSFLGEPNRIMAKTLKHPEGTVSSTRSSMILDYNDTLRAVIDTNHDHKFGTDKQQSYIKWEGTKGVIYAKMGLLLDYPHGMPDSFEYCLIDSDADPEWQTVNLEGSWFPDAFIGTMASLMRFVEGSEVNLPTSVQDAIKTMALVEAAYKSSNNP